MFWSHFLHCTLYKHCFIPTAEAEKRLRIFKENMKTVQTLRSLEQGSAEYGVTKFSDLTGMCTEELIINEALIKKYS